MIYLFSDSPNRDRVESAGDALIVVSAIGIGSGFILITFHHRIIPVVIATLLTNFVAIVVRNVLMFTIIPRFLTVAQFGLLTSLALALAGVAVVTGLRINFDRRHRFETDMRRRLTTSVLAAKEARIRATLAMLLPDEATRRIIRGEPVRDIGGPSCVMIATRITDFPMWGSWYMPMVAAKIVDRLLSVFDDKTKKYNCHKVSQTDEYYVTSSGLRNYGTHGIDLVDEGLALRFANLQVSLARFYSVRIRRAVTASADASAALAISVGVHRGPATGTFVGTRQLSYAVGGSSCNGAVRLAQIAPANTVYSSAAAVEGTQGFYLQPVKDPHPSLQKLVGGWGILRTSSTESAAPMEQQQDPAYPNPKQQLPPPRTERGLGGQNGGREQRGPAHFDAPRGGQSSPFEDVLSHVSTPEQRSPVPVELLPVAAPENGGHDVESMQSALRLRFLGEQVKKNRAVKPQQSQESSSTTLPTPIIPHFMDDPNAGANPPPPAPDAATLKLEVVELPLGQFEQRHWLFPVVQSFRVPAIENDFWESQSHVGPSPDPFGRTKEPWHQVHYFLVCLAAFTDVVIESAHTAPSLILLTVALVGVTWTWLLGARLRLPVVFHFLWETIVGLLLIVGVRLSKPCLFNGNVLPLFIEIGNGTLVSYRWPASWLLVSMKLLTFPVLELALLFNGVGRGGGNSTFSSNVSAVYGPIFLLLAGGAWVVERETRLAYVALQQLRRAERAFDLANTQQRVLLSMLLPPFVLERAVIGDGAKLFHKTMTIDFPDFVMMNVRFPHRGLTEIQGAGPGEQASNDPTGGGSSWEKVFLKLEEAFLQDMGSALIGVIHVLGDDVRLGGPMILPSPEKSGPPTASAAQAILSRAMMQLPAACSLAEAEALVQSAAVSLVLTLCHLTECGEFGDLSACLVAEAGCGTVIGSLLPTFAAVGVVSRVMSAVASALPSGRIVMTSKFESILTHGLSHSPRVGPKPGLPAPLRRGARVAWRLRGVGFVDVQYLFAEKPSPSQLPFLGAAATPRPTIPPPKC
jgi:hypothetical protein